MFRNDRFKSDGRYINDGVVQSALLMFPQFPVYNSDGTYAVGNQIAMKADGYQMVENPWHLLMKLISATSQAE